MLITGIVFIGVFAVLSVLDCFLGEDGWYLVDLKQAQDAKHYFGKFENKYCDPKFESYYSAVLVISVNH